MVITAFLKLIMSFFIFLCCPTANNVGFKDFIPFFSVVPSFFSVIVAAFAVYIAMRNTNVTIRTGRLNSIIETISRFLVEVDHRKCSWAKLADKNYVSDEHNFLENKIIMLLDDKEEDERELISTIKRFKEESVGPELFTELRNKIVVLTRKATTKEQI